MIANFAFDQLFSNLPGKYGGIFLFHQFNVFDNLGRGHAWLTTADGSGLNRARFVVAAENFAHTTVGNLQETRYFARSCALVSHVDDFLAHCVRQRATVDKHAAQLIHATVTFEDKLKNKNYSSQIFVKLFLSRDHLETNFKTPILTIRESI
jgi:hypothetical protein